MTLIKEAFVNIVRKENAGNQYFSFSINVFYPFPNQFPFLNHVYFVICKVFNRIWTSLKYFRLAKSLNLLEQVLVCFSIQTFKSSKVSFGKTCIGHSYCHYSHSTLKATLLARSKKLGEISEIYQVSKWQNHWIKSYSLKGIYTSLALALLSPSNTRL